MCPLLKVSVGVTQIFLATQPIKREDDVTRRSSEVSDGRHVRARTFSLRNHPCPFKYNHFRPDNAVFMCVSSYSDYRSPASVSVCLYFISVHYERCLVSNGRVAVQGLARFVSQHACCFLVDCYCTDRSVQGWQKRCLHFQTGPLCTSISSQYCCTCAQ